MRIVACVYAMGPTYRFPFPPVSHPRSSYTTTPTLGRYSLDTSRLQLPRAGGERVALLPGLLGPGDRVVPPRGNRSGGGVPVRGMGGVPAGAGHEDVGFRPVLHPVPAHLQVCLPKIVLGGWHG